MLKLTTLKSRLWLSIMCTSRSLRERNEVCREEGDRFHIERELSKYNEGENSKFVEKKLSIMREKKVRVSREKLK